METTPSHLLSLEEVANYLNVNQRYVRSLVQTGKLPVVFFSHKIKRVDPKEIEKLIQSKTFTNGWPKDGFGGDMKAARAAVLKNRKARKGKPAPVEVINTLEAAEQKLEPPVLLPGSNGEAAEIATEPPPFDWPNDDMDI